MDLNILQHYWWILICILGGLLVFLLFVQGGQSLLYTIGKNKDERDLIVNTLGHKWEYTFTTLVVFGGAFFASFPLFYSTSFGGAYVVWMLILFCFVLQAVSYEYRNKKNNKSIKKRAIYFPSSKRSLPTTLIPQIVLQIQRKKLSLHRNQKNIDRGCGVIGSRARLRIWCLATCRFESYQPHKNFKSPESFVFKTFFYPVKWSSLLYFGIYVKNRRCAHLWNIPKYPYNRA